MTEIELITAQLGDAIHACKEYVEYNEAKKAYDENEEIQNLAGEFNLKKMAVLNEMKKEDKDDAKIKTLQDEMRAVYSELMVHPVMENYNDKKEVLETVINKIYEDINFFVTGEHPHECSGSCESCGGCH